MIGRQRGGLLLDGIMALAAVAGLAWGNNLLKHHYIDPVEAKYQAHYQPLDEQCKSIGNENPADCATAVRAAIAGRDTCLAANRSLDEQFATFRKMHNAAIEFEHAEYDKAVARKAAAKSEAAPKLAEIAIEKFNLIVAAGQDGLTCKQMDEALLLEAERRQRFYGPPTAAQQRSPADGVRIVEPAPTPSARPAVVNPLKPKP